MIISMAVVLMALAWLICETDYCRIRLLYGRIPAPPMLVEHVDWIEWQIDWLAVPVREAVAEINRLSTVPETLHVAVVRAIKNLEIELGNRSLPYHGGAKAKFYGQKTTDLWEQYKVFKWFEQSIPSLGLERPEMIEQAETSAMTAYRGWKAPPSPMRGAQV